ncbi:DUF6526 family protein [Paludibaculum fermentans]|uniref:Uncharacterized protein n=1 Tax=Paludibaculum fermentans TaxID=1473598 RepID=A0A7S7NQ53_PALFE|nr:DUF6526 family protein [Paludibaculum fermentans]QOY87755.1 hypothetical protein IRI77_34270 [Paludibaculum fermentans]
MQEQSYAKHARTVPMYHFVLFGMLLLTLIGSGVNLWKSMGDHQRLYSAALILVMNVCMVFIALFARIFALKAQDRAIRAEENLRHFVLTGKLLDPRLEALQIVALRFAPDAEFVALAQLAADKNMSQDDIKKSIKNWKADNYRV